jgi:glycosyltransferase involved in cell wall biosynthesis
VQVLASLAFAGRCTVVLVASSSTPQEERVAATLRAAGVHLFTEYLPAIHELYQLADCYVFPVRSTDNAIELPLSVLEALACDLPVVTTRFGDLPALFDCPGRPPGFVFVDTPGELCSEAARLSRAAAAGGGTRPLAIPYSWDAVAERLLAGVGISRGNEDGK